MRMPTVVFTLCCVGLAGVAPAQVVMERAADGTVVITNHKRGARTASNGGRGVTIAQRSAAAGDVHVLTRATTLPTAPARIQVWVDRYARAERLNRDLVLSVIAAESNFNAGALSHKGAIGLMQLMPATARELGIDDPWDPESNVRGGTRYLRQMLDRFDDDLELALAAYNAGPGAVERNGGVPPYRETQNYVRRVLSRYHGRPFDLTGVKVADAKPRTRPIEVRRDENGHLVILTP